MLIIWPHVLDDGGRVIVLPLAVALDMTVLVLEGEAGTLTVTVDIGRGGLGACQAQAGDRGQEQKQAGQHGGVHHDELFEALNGMYNLDCFIEEKGET